jgi:16S rRNA (adenine(1408)-N(1))-methyltransferase
MALEITWSSLEGSVNINKEELKRYVRVEIDIGTGDGRFVYRSALKNPQILYIGIDPSQKQLGIYSKKINRKRLKNALLIAGSAEELPEALTNIANTIYIILPWGSLLRHVAKPNISILKEIAKLMKANGTLEVIFGYAEETEPVETERLDLEAINEAYITDTLLAAYEKAGFKLEAFDKLTKKDLSKFESTWCKKLSFGKERPLFYLKFSKK